MAPRVPSQRLASGAPRLIGSRTSLRLASGAERLDMRRLPLSEGTVYDPSLWLSGSATDGGDGSGISATLIGGVSTTDPLVGVYIVWPLMDSAGRQLASGGRHLVLPWQVSIRTGPGDSSDTEIAFGLINEAVDSATIDGFLHGIRYTGASRSPRRATITNGAATLAAGTGGIGTAEGLAGAWVVSGTGGHIGGSGTVGLTSAEAVITSGSPHWAGNAAIAVGTGQLWAVLAIWRTATTAGNVTAAVDVYVRNAPVPSGLTA